MLNDLFILRKIKEGNVKAFESLFRQYYSSLYLYALSITGRKDISEEIVQELFYILWKERESIEIYRSLKSYLYRAVRNQSLQYHERTNIETRHREKVLSNNLKQASDGRKKIQRDSRITICIHQNSRSRNVQNI